MKNKKLLAAIAVTTLLTFNFSGCGDDPMGDVSIEQITIYNIPATILVRDNTKITNPTFRVYLNASDSMDETDPPKAKGFVQVTPEMLQPNGTYTVTMQLQNPNPDFYEEWYDANPNMETGPWSGTTLYFSIMISPQDVRPHGENAVWVKGNNDLNAGKANWNWNNRIDFRIVTSIGNINLNEKVAALYNDIICSDPFITTE